MKTLQSTEGLQPGDKLHYWNYGYEAHMKVPSLYGGGYKVEVLEVIDNTSVRVRMDDMVFVTHIDYLTD